MPRNLALKILAGLVVVFSLIVIVYSVGQIYGTVNPSILVERQKNIVKNFDEVRERLTNDPWDYKITPVSVTVAKVTPANRTLVVKFQWPPGMFLYGEERMVDVTCSREESELTYVDITRTDNKIASETKGVDFFETIKVNDSLTTYCLNETCSTLGKSCVIRKFIRK